MKKLLTTLLTISTLSFGTVIADTLELADGTLLEGEFVGSSNGIIMFNTGSNIEAFPDDQVVGIFLSSGVATAEAAAQEPVAAAPTTVTVPAGTRLVIRTTDSIDSRRHQAGHRFRGQLESAVTIDGIRVIPRRAYVHGRITQASQAGRAVGSSDMSIEFTDIMVNDQLFEIATDGMQAQTGNEAARTAGRTARAAVIGGLIGGNRSGARTGAAVGLGASLLTSGQSINIPAGTILETRLRTPLSLPQ
ncbi:MAG: hypothetical protein ABJK20_00830 [Halieaceae bacterium]